MKQIRTTLFVLALLLTIILPFSGNAEAAGPNPVVVMETSMGRVIIQLYEDKTPITVKNFLRYVEAGFYDGTIFHRVIKQNGGMNVVQGGGFNYPMLQKRALWRPIPNEEATGLDNVRGTIAMARGGHPDSADSQFFFNVEDNNMLNPIRQGNNMGTISIKKNGYCAFGKVLRGMNVLDNILKVKTGSRGMHKNVPVKPVYLKKAYIAR